jgi:transposase
MYVRVKSTPNSPRKSVQIVQSVRKGDKVTQKIIRHIGVAMDENELLKLQMLAESIKIKLEADGQELLFSPEYLAGLKQQKEKAEDTAGADRKPFEVNLKDLIEEERIVSGIHEVYGALFEELGFDRVIKNPARHRYGVELFRNIVMGRIANPVSKRATVGMLEEDFGISLDLEAVYRMMDLLDEGAIGRLNDLSYSATWSLFRERIDVIFFDCTTIYFETFEEDSFRKNGWSKDLKFNQPQVLIALMVTREGLPIGYQAFEGDKYEGHTLIPAIAALKNRHDLGRIVVVGDAGMLNQENLKVLEQSQEICEYIIGSRIRGMPDVMKAQILDMSRYEESQDGEGTRIGCFDYKGKKLIVSYSPQRARKDAWERERAIKKLTEKLKKKKNPKEYLSNFGYKKYLKMTGKTSFELDEDKIQADSQWDGLLGIITNAQDLSSREALNQYHNLWQVEYAFRVTKHDLKVRPVFHWKPSRVKAHLAISFAAFTLIKHMEYRVKLQYQKMSPEKIRQSLVRVQTSILYDKKKEIRFAFPSKMSQDAKKIYRIFRLPEARTPHIIRKM